MSGKALGRFVGRVALIPLLLNPTTSSAQVASSAPSVAPADAPPAPIAPEVISRRADGNATLRATRIRDPLRIDGRLDEAVYTEVRAAGDFIQQEPHQGEPATEKTEAWILFDSRNVYVAGRCWDSQPDRMVANDMRRDGANIRANDNFAVILDTFLDRRNGFLFYLNPIGGMYDGQVTDERANNADWNTIWDGKVGRFDGGWVVEMVIPFKSLRYPPGTVQTWGINLRRSVRWKNEQSFVTLVPASAGPPGILKLSSAGTLVGLEVPPATSKNLELKPYAIASLRTDRTAHPAITNDPDGDLGFDVKYGVTKGLTADFTYNTDFAQVEEDEQQVNLTRFSVFFPEKREFFLESQGIFAFGGLGTRGLGGGGGAGGSGTYLFGGGGRRSSDNTPVLFFSRRIGLNQGSPVPIQAGGRLTGKVGNYSIGLLDIQADEEPATETRPTHFSVVRVRRDILRRSTIGAMVTRRSVSVIGDGANDAYGIDATFSFHEALNVNAYLARTRTLELRGADTSYLAQLDYNGDRYGLQVERLVVGDHFNPEVGFLRRADFRRTFGQFRFSPRPTSIRAVRKFAWEASYDYFTNSKGRLDTREVQGQFRTEFNNGDQFSTEYTLSYEFLADVFQIAPGVDVPVGGYSFRNINGSYLLGPQRTAAGQLSIERGSFFAGTKTAASYRGRIEMTPRLSLEPGLSFNWIDLPGGRFTTSLVSTRAIYTLTPRMFVAALAQYNSSSSSLSTNARLRWEYQPGSELFLVYSEGRDTLARGLPLLQNRGLVVKVNRLVRF